MSRWDYDKFARGEGFRSGKHRNDFYAGRDASSSGCLMVLLVFIYSIVRRYW